MEASTYHFDPTLLQDKRWVDKTKYYLLPLEKTDAEYQKIEKLFMETASKGWHIKKMDLIWNKELSRGFDLQRGVLSNRSNKPTFQPTYHLENDATHRKNTFERLQKYASKFNSSNEVITVPVFHGTSSEVLHDICSDGFACLKSTDAGYFGQGLYFTNSSEYAGKIYAKESNGQKILIFSWISLGNVYPVIEGDMEKLSGKASYKNYDSHYVPVKPASSSPFETAYFPCNDKTPAVYDEYVIFNSFQAIPRCVIYFSTQPPVQSPTTSTVTTNPLLTGVISPKQANTWTVDDVANWIKSLGLTEDYTGVIYENGIDGENLCSDLQTKESWKELGIKKFGDLAKIERNAKLISGGGSTLGTSSPQVDRETPLVQPKAVDSNPIPYQQPPQQQIPPQQPLQQPYQQPPNYQQNPQPYPPQQYPPYQNSPQMNPYQQQNPYVQNPYQPQVPQQQPYGYGQQQVQTNLYPNPNMNNPYVNYNSGNDFNSNRYGINKPHGRYFDTKSANPLIRFSNAGTKIQLSGIKPGDKKQWVTTSLLPMLGEESCYVEFEINTVGIGGLFVGIGSIIKEGFNVGSTSNSWGYMSAGQMYVNGERTSLQIVGYHVGDKMGVFYMVKNGQKELHFYKNGIDLGKMDSFNNAKTLGTKLYFQVTLYDEGDSMSLLPTSYPVDNANYYPNNTNFGLYPFPPFPTPINFWTFDKSNAEYNKKVNQFVEISADGKIATHLGPTAQEGWITMNIMPGFGNETCYIEFNINKIGTGGVFVGVGSVIMNRMNVGSSSTSWGYMSTGQLYVNGVVRHKYVPFVEGDRIGVLYGRRKEKDDHELYFFKNGSNLGRVESFNKGSTLGTKLYPQITMYSAKDSMTIVTVPPPITVLPVEFISHKFDPNGKPIEISADGKTSTYVGSSPTDGSPSWVTINLQPQYKDESCYIEYKINKVGTGGVFVGIGNVLKEGFNVGSTSISWGYMSSGSLYVNGKIETTYVGYVAGDVVGVWYRFIDGNRELYFYKNGDSLGRVPSFNNSSTVGTRLFPQTTYRNNSDSISLVATRDKP